MWGLIRKNETQGQVRQLRLIQHLRERKGGRNLGLQKGGKQFIERWEKQMFSK